MEHATEQSERQAWDRRPDETLQAYEAFTAYRDMPRPRSVDEAYRNHLRERTGGEIKKSLQASGRWWTWNTNHEWRSRVESYDGYLELKRRDKHEADYLQKLDAHLDRLQKIGEAQQNIALNMLNIAQAEIAGLATPEQKALLKSKTFSSFVRAAERLSAGAAEMEGQGLGIAEMVGILNSNERTDQRT